MKNYHYINYKYKKKEYKLYLLLSKIGISFYYTFKNDHLIPHINGKEKSRRGWKKLETKLDRRDLLKIEYGNEAFDLYDLPSKYQSKRRFYPTNIVSSKYHRMNILYEMW